jgi:hypothetical protein
MLYVVQVQLSLLKMSTSILNLNCKVGESLVAKTVLTSALYKNQVCLVPRHILPHLKLGKINQVR